MNYTSIVFSKKEAEALRELLEEAEGTPVQYTPGLREIWYRGENTEMELRILFLFNFKITVSRVCFTRRRKGTMTKVFDFLMDFCRNKQIEKIVVQSVETPEMAAWCLKNGLIPDIASSFFMENYYIGDYWTNTNYSLPAQYDLNWINTKIPEILPKVKEYWNTADYNTVPFQNSSFIHDANHCKRVLFYSILLSHLLKCTNEESNILAQAAIYHDVGRTDDGFDPKHGEISATRYLDKIPSSNSVSAFLMKYHSKEDAEGEEVIKKEYDDDLEIWLLFQIFKDADALDRIRLGQNDLKPEFLRLDQSKKLVFASIFLIQNQHILN